MVHTIHGTLHIVCSKCNAMLHKTLIESNCTGNVYTKIQPVSTKISWTMWVCDVTTAVHTMRTRVLWLFGSGNSGSPRRRRSIKIQTHEVCVYSLVLVCRTKMPAVETRTHTHMHVGNTLNVERKRNRIAKRICARRCVAETERDGMRCMCTCSMYLLLLQTQTNAFAFTFSWYDMAVIVPRRRRKKSEQKKQENRSQLCNWACRVAIAMAMVMRLSLALPLTVRATRYCHRNDNGERMAMEISALLMLMNIDWYGLLRFRSIFGKSKIWNK